METTFKMVSIRLRSGIHLGEREFELEGSEVFPHSDTLFSAFCHGYRLLYGKSDLTNLLVAFENGAPPFRVSSAYPQWGGTCFFPIPLNQMVREKELKKAAWVEKEGWEKLLAGSRLEEIHEHYRLLPPSKAMDFPSPVELGGRGETGFPWTSQETPRVGLNRLNNHPDERYFHFTQVLFHPQVSSFFLIQLSDEAVWPKIQATWRLMADEGLGGDRSTGKGLFHSLEFQEMTLRAPDDANARLLLSLYYPAGEETDCLRGAWYEFIERRGYMFSPDGGSLRRQGVRLLREGSVVDGAFHPSGQLVKVQPSLFKEHPVYRYGLALTVPCLDHGGDTDAT